MSDSSDEDLFKPGPDKAAPWRSELEAAAPDEDAFRLQQYQQMQAQNAGRGLYSAGQAARSLQDALAARRGQQQAAGMLADRAAGRGPSAAALQGQQAVAQAGQAANAAAAGGRGAGGMALAQRLAMANGGMAAGDAAMQAAAGRNREVGQSQAALGQALAQMRQGDIGESSQNAATAKAYFDAQMRVRQEQAAMAAAYERGKATDALRKVGQQMEDRAVYERLAQADYENRRQLAGSILNAGSGVAGFTAGVMRGDDSSGYDPNSPIRRENPYG